MNHDMETARRSVVNRVYIIFHSIPESEFPSPLLYKVSPNESALLYWNTLDEAVLFAKQMEDPDSYEPKLLTKAYFDAFAVADDGSARIILAPYDSTKRIN